MWPGRSVAASKQKRSFLEWLVHSYLFFRVPLVRPQVWLARQQPWLERLHMPTVTALIGLIALLGMYLVSRQWDVFTHTLVDNLTWNGALGYIVALLLAKTIHELGHALVATHYGVRVAHMGVAFLVMFPMLYTDTGESWRLKNARHRLAIASAGVAVELALASVATLLWSLSPDGAFRNGLFFLATTSWVLTLAVNASPFMRFDGYFVFSDMLDLPNLHERSSALARNWLRRTVLGVAGSLGRELQPGQAPLIDRVCAVHLVVPLDGVHRYRLAGVPLLFQDAGHRVDVPGAGVVHWPAGVQGADGVERAQSGGHLPSQVDHGRFAGLVCACGWCFRSAAGSVAMDGPMRLISNLCMRLLRPSWCRCRPSAASRLETCCLCWIHRFCRLHRIDRSNWPRRARVRSPASWACPMAKPSVNC